MEEIADGYVIEKNLYVKGVIWASDIQGASITATIPLATATTIGGMKIDSGTTDFFLDGNGVLQTTSVTGNYLLKTSNLSDLTSVSAARTNLSVYAKSEVYTKTEIDAFGYLKESDNATITGDWVFDNILRLNSGLAVQQSDVFIGGLNESRYLRFTENNSPSATYLGAYINYDGTADIFKIGVNNVDAVASVNDKDSIQIVRSTGQVSLLHNESEKLITESTGITVTGVLEATGITVGTSNIIISNTIPQLIFEDTDFTGGGKYWRTRINGGDFYLENDDNSSFSSAATSLLAEPEGGITLYHNLLAKIGTETYGTSISGTATDITNQSYLAFYQSGSTREGYVGISSTSSADMYIYSDSANVQIVANDSSVTRHLFGDDYVQINGESLNFGTLNIRQRGVTNEDGIFLYFDALYSFRVYIDSSNIVNFDRGGSSTWKLNATGVWYTATYTSGATSGDGAAIQQDGEGIFNSINSRGNIELNQNAETQASGFSIYNNNISHVNGGFYHDSGNRITLFRDTTDMWQWQANGQYNTDTYTNSSFTGAGAAVTQAGAGIFQDLTVRGTLQVYELLIQQIRASNGSIWVSDAQKYELDYGSDATYWYIGIDPEGGNRSTPFVAGDIIRAQIWTGSGISQTTLEVFDIDSGGEYFRALKSTQIGDDPTVGVSEFVRIGSTSDVDRRGAVYLTASDNDNPFIDAVDGLSTIGGSLTSRARFGRLDGINSPVWGQLSGYGLWSENVYLEGSISATTGFIGGFIIDSTSIRDTQGHVHMISDDREIMITRETVTTSTPSDNSIQLYYTSNSDWGMVGRLAADKIFELGSTNQIAGWEFTDQYLLKGDFSIGGQTIMLNTINSGSSYSYVYDGSRKLAGLSIPWYQSSNAGHIVVGQITSSGYSLKTGYFGIQMMSWLGEEYFALSADVSVSGTRPVYNRIAGWSFDNSAIWNGSKLGSGAGVQIDSTSKTISIHQDQANLVKMWYESSLYWGLTGEIDGNPIFQLGSDNFIASWNFDESYLWSGTKQTSNAYSTSGITIASAGAIRAPEFRVDTDGSAYFKGALEAASGTFTGALTAATGTFSGELVAASGSFSGSVIASFGTIGGFTIDSTRIYNITGSQQLIFDAANRTITAGNTTIGAEVVIDGDNGSITLDNSFTDSSALRFTSSGILKGAMKLDDNDLIIDAKHSFELISATSGTITVGSGFSNGINLNTDDGGALAVQSNANLITINTPVTFNDGATFSSGDVYLGVDSYHKGKQTIWTSNTTVFVSSSSVLNYDVLVWTGSGSTTDKSIYRGSSLFNGKVLQILNAGSGTIEISTGIDININIDQRRSRTFVYYNGYWYPSQI